MEAIELFEDDNNMDSSDRNVMAEENIVPAPNDAEGNIESSGVHSWQGDNNYFIPECCEKEKPIIRQQFASMEEGVAFYKLYAVEAGFDVRCSIVRKNKEGYIEVRYLLCSREGHTTSTTDGTNCNDEDATPNTKTRRRVSNRVGCNARCVIRRRKDGVYAVTIFEEKHNHPLCSESGRMFLKINRSLDVGDQEFISACAKANIGTSKEFELYAELTGGFDKVGATCVDFRNCKRDVNAYLHEADAQAVQLRGLFWADPIAKENYQRFGDMVSFDATYSTNR
nr:protein FAR1-RELATED SEQUENCE 5-like [Ipomoea batatas]